MPDSVWRLIFNHKYAFINAIVMIAQYLGWSQESAYDHQPGNQHLDFALLAEARIDNCSGFVLITFRRTPCSITL